LFFCRLLDGPDWARIEFIPERNILFRGANFSAARAAHPMFFFMQQAVVQSFRPAGDGAYSARVKNFAGNKTRFK
jgi:hypothetical protein